ncbi:tRNA (adenosine(37)-N6)-threonylcarbamoyltransferase complex ATPase subunit type 1 TsaE [Alkalibaculum sp. M08DMB]|uniref:tRNA threonylcarbamoyladenosine biosynthesis protein TsaE n=1 Tax=Alkalibaculum sporogenes TaxID=2655001 RepID=A0A6A7K677_9FIRM|nr:tRNA (adenosine(37)-N6)-threonylcarbamoyltransferase complex ATPase subunit type 1 TsaE [Alkalibaculum sporogenes]MPW24875.1 tRNA (adenosine(37)-N6)-threonylcarbamoyltransferase complex ATPase subunit type 1 TsaE [Alkalibaculum sporogenes]
MKLRSNSPNETYDLGFTLGSYIEWGLIVCIEGEMGAGKTALSQGIIRGLGVVEKYITSPTYTLVNEYKVRDLSIYHFDVYRVGDYDELSAIGFEEYFNEGSIVVIEWADMIRENLPDNSIWINIERVDHENLREISIKGIEKLKKPLREELRKWEKI